MNSEGRATGLVPWLVFPAILGSAIAAAVWLTGRGVSPAMTALWVQAGAVFAIATAERLWPHRAQWNASHGDVGVDATHAIVSGLAGLQLLRPVLYAGGIAVAGWLSRTFGSDLWPDHWPVLAQLALALTLGELPQYWLHRWQHEWEPLWRFHAIHHSAPRLYWLNAARFHPGDLLLLFAVWYAPLVALGCDERVLALAALFDAVFGMLQHCNIEVRLGPLNYVFSMAEPHRWHHSQVPAEANTNYGSNLLLWDLVFGTFYLPRDRPTPATIGIAGMSEFPRRYLAQLAFPFVRRRAAGSARLETTV